MYGSTKMSQIQQKLFAKEAYQSKWLIDVSAFVDSGVRETYGGEFKWNTTICLLEVFGEIGQKLLKNRRFFILTIRFLTQINFGWSKIIN